MNMLTRLNPVKRFGTFTKISSVFQGSFVNQRYFNSTSSALQQYVQRRLDLFEKHYQEQMKAVQKLASQKKEILITVGDETFKTIAYATTPMELAKKTMNKKQYKKIVGAKIIDPNGGKDRIIDLSKPLEESVNLQFIFQDEREGKEIFWHSSAHILGHSLEDLYSCLLCTGPVKEHEGFYYDANFPKNEETITSDQLQKIQKAVNKLVKQNKEFQRIDVTYEQA